MDSFIAVSNPLVIDSGMTMSLSNPSLKYLKRKSLPFEDVWGDTVRAKETRRVIDFMRSQGVTPPNPGAPNFGNEVVRTQILLKKDPAFRGADLSQVDWADVALTLKPISVQKIPAKTAPPVRVLAESRGIGAR